MLCCHSAGAFCRYGSGTEDQPDQDTATLPERPEFPPPSLNLVPAFAADLPQKQGSDMLMVCAFLQSFSSLLGLAPVTVDNLLAAGEQHMTLWPVGTKQDATYSTQFMTAMTLHYLPDAIMPAQSMV